MPMIAKKCQHCGDCFFGSYYPGLICEECYRKHEEAERLKKSEETAAVCQCGKVTQEMINGFCLDCDKRQEAETRELETHEKPALGLKPRDIHDDGRISDILGAVARAMDGGYKIPIVWIDEYNYIVENRQDRRLREHGKGK